MTDTPTKIVVDCSTGEVKELPLTAEEIAQREADAAAFAEASRISASCCQVGPLIGNGAKSKVLSSVNCQTNLLFTFAQV